MPRRGDGFFPGRGESVRKLLNDMVHNFHKLLLWWMVSSGMLRRVALVKTDVSEEPGASFIRVTRIGELGTTQAATRNWRTLRRNTQRTSAPSDDWQSSKLIWPVRQSAGVIERDVTCASFTVLNCRSLDKFWARSFSRLWGSRLNPFMGGLWARCTARQLTKHHVRFVSCFNSSLWIGASLLIAG
jgi:hypothetical protein